MLEFVQFYIFTFFVIFVFNVTGLEVENIIGGHYAAEGQFKYHVSIQVADKHQCGGSFIANDLVLTAGHCFFDDSLDLIKSPYQVKAGLINLKSNAAFKANVSAVYVHKNFKRFEDGTNTADIAILRLGSWNVDGYGNSAKLDLPKQNNYLHKMAMVSGFGWDAVKIVKNEETGEEEEIGSGSGLLKHVKVKVVQDAACQGLSYKEGHDKYICGQALQSKKNEGMCKGDSGSGLVYEKTIIGVVSTNNIGCDESAAPGSYLRVFNYMNFINGVMTNDLTPETIVWNVDECMCDNTSKSDRMKKGCSGLFFV